MCARCDHFCVSFYEGPAVVVLEGSTVEVTAWLTSTVVAGSPIKRWRGQIVPQNEGSLWPAHMAGRASIIMQGGTGVFRIIAYNDSGPSLIDGIGPAPFS